VEEGIPSEEVLQLIKTEPPKATPGNQSGDQDYQVYQHENQQANDPFASYFYSQQVFSVEYYYLCFLIFNLYLNI
jgi:hypothetical protein